MRPGKKLLLVAFVLVVSGAPTWAEDAATINAASQVNWSLATPTGETVRFPHPHDEPVILMFWASWCPFCKALMPHLQSLLYEYPDDGLTIYAINFRDDGDPVAFMQARGYEFNLLVDGGDVAADYAIHATPGLLIFDRNNQLVLNLYDVMTDSNEEMTLPTNLSARQKAARKAPYWAAEIRRALDAIQ